RHDQLGSQVARKRRFPATRFFFQSAIYSPPGVRRLVAPLMPKTLLVTGSSGLIGSEVCAYFARELGYKVHGVDNNQRAIFFGPAGDTRWNQHRLEQDLFGFVHHELDIRDRAGVLALVRDIRPAAI